jgi:queuine tRNA-ribosyltransferase
MNNAQFRLDDRPIEEGCQCPVCRRYSRAYVHHLIKAGEMLGMRMCVEHNLFFYNRLMQEIRDALDEGRFSIYKKDMLEKLSSGDGI